MKRWELCEEYGDQVIRAIEKHKTPNGEKYIVLERSRFDSRTIRSSKYYDDPEEAIRTLKEYRKGGE